MAEDARIIAKQRLKDALALHDQGQIEQAAELYEQVLMLDADLPFALHNLGIIEASRGHMPRAYELVERSVLLDPDNVEARVNLSSLALRLNQLEQAIKQCQIVLCAEPGHAVAYANLGEGLQKLGRADEAISAYERAISLDPAQTVAMTNLGGLLMDRGAFTEAGRLFATALSLQPEKATAHYNVAKALKALGRLEEAAGFYEACLTLAPNYVDAWINLGNIRRDQSDIPAALAAYERVAALAPSSVLAHLNFGHILREAGQTERAVAHFQTVLALDPHNPGALFSLAMARLPILYRTADEVETARAAYEAALHGLVDSFNKYGGQRDFSAGIGASQPFYLAYQGQNDRELQKLYGGLVCAIMARRFGPAKIAAAPAPGERIRVGFVSGFFRGHSNWKIPIKGWAEGLDRDAFQLFAYHTGALQDQRTEAAKALFERFVQGPLSLETWRETILADAPHVLIYPEIGMDPMASQLAAQRLAPVQCNSWGHPDTSGFPTLDYYLSSDLMEPEDGQDHYTETLIRLPGLGVVCEPVEIDLQTGDRARAGYDEDRIVYWCAQSLFKYLPEYDFVFARIAKALPKAQFAFISSSHGPETSGLFASRLVEAFAAEGLMASDHCLMLPRLDKPDFLNAAAAADVFLDSLGWSGCNSALESLAQDLPIVTWAAPLMRGRHSAAILRQIEVPELIADSVEDYIALAVRLGQDESLRQALRRKIAVGRAKLYHDPAPVRGLERFLRDVWRKSAP